MKLWENKRVTKRCWDLVGYIFRAYFSSRRRRPYTPKWINLPLLVSDSADNQYSSPLQMSPDGNVFTRSQIQRKLLFIHEQCTGKETKLDQT